MYHRNTESESLKLAKNRFHFNKRSQNAAKDSNYSYQTPNQQNENQVDMMKRTKDEVRSKQSQNVRVKSYNNSKNSAITSRSNSKIQITKRPMPLARRPEYMQVISDRPNTRLYRQSSVSTLYNYVVPPSIIRVDGHSLSNNNQESALSNIEKTEKTLDLNYQPIFVTEIENLRKEVKKEIDEILKSLEILKEENLKLRIQCDNLKTQTVNDTIVN
jgi:hypothetical protein